MHEIRERIRFWRDLVEDAHPGMASSLVHAEVAKRIGAIIDSPLNNPDEKGELK